MLERRQYERFDLTLPTSIEVMTSEREETFDSLSTDISAGGVYVYPNRFIPEGTQVKLNLEVTNERLKRLKDTKGLMIRAEGTVVRTTPRGMAICFGEDCQILSLAK